jgi:small-conductance mechanosensitive channel
MPPFRIKAVLVFGMALTLAGASNVWAQDPVEADSGFGKISLVDSSLTQLRLELQTAYDSLAQSIEGLRSEVALLREGRGRLQSDTAQAATDRGRDAVRSDLREARSRISGLAWKVVRSLLLILLVFYLVKVISWLLGVLAERDSRRRLLFKRLEPIIRVVLWAFAVYLIISVIFEITGAQLWAASAAVGVAIGFASQDILKNIFGGLIIILDKPFQVGDKINVGGTYGEVVSIGLRATRIQTPDDNLVSVPNAQVVDGQVSNANAGNLDCQVVTHLYLPGWIDVMKAKRIAYDAAANSQYVFLDKPIVVIVQDEFKETFLTHIKVKAYVLDTRLEQRFSSDITETAKTQFLKEGMLSPMVDIPTVSQSHLGDVQNGQNDSSS